jgi:hypothetical protein
VRSVNEQGIHLLARQFVAKLNLTESNARIGLRAIEQNNTGSQPVTFSGTTQRNQRKTASVRPEVLRRSDALSLFHRRASDDAIGGCISSAFKKLT